MLKTCSTVNATLQQTKKKQKTELLHQQRTKYFHKATEIMMPYMI